MRYHLTVSEVSDSLATAIDLTGLDAGFLTPFETEDPFNAGLRLAGYLSQKPDHRYGALAITHVAGKPAPQLIYATPKLHYPFGKDGRFHFPAIQRVYLHEKLDGTNVLAYRYHGADGSAYLSYKLRLFPVLRNSKWGPFLDMWRELMARYPRVPELVNANGCHISIEMFGARNAHLIAYDVDLDLAVLFGVRPADASIVPPAQLDLVGVPAAPLIGELVAGEDPVARYDAVRHEMQQRNKPIDGDKLSGTEGAVWHVVEPSGHASLWKCKPESVEQIHWATGINKASVSATCWNVLETSDVLTYETLLPLLLEEYQPDDIARFRPHIDAAITQVNREFELRERVRAAYDVLRAQGLSVNADKGAVMRALAPHFSREEMRKAYQIVAAYDPLLVKA